MRRYLILISFSCLAVPAFCQSISPAGPIALCSGASATLTASSGDTYQWRRNGTDIPGATNKTLVVNQAGTYSVVITINNNQSTSQNVVVTTPGSPTASFTFPAGQLCASSIQLTGSATGGTAPYTYSWSFSDGGSSAIQNPVHSFNATGCGNTSVFATLTVTDANGCTSAQTRNMTVQQAPDIRLEDAINPFAPFSNCENNPGPANPNYTITVNNTSPSTCVTSYSLDWGDGSPVVTGLSKASFPLTHTYTSLGAFNMVLTGIGSNGCSYSKTYVVANQSNPDIGIATTGITEGCADLPVNIKISYWQANSPGTTYFLEYGDGNTRPMTHPINATNTDETINYTYSSSSCETNGTPDYRLVISATNACRTKRFEGGNIVVKTKPQPAFGAPSAACAGQQACFTNETIAGYNNNCSTLTQYQWDFGDPGSGANNSSTAVNGCHNYSTPGNYTVTLTTTNGCGSSTASRTICVNAAATPSFQLDDEDVCLGSTVTAANTSVLGNCVSAGYQWNVSYTSAFCGTGPAWSFTGGTTSTSANPSFIFNAPGTYTITLALTGACGSGTTQRTVTVKQRPGVVLQAVDNACGQAVITPVATITSCSNTTPTYLWEFDGGAAGTSPNANPGSVTFNTPGLHTIALSITNECGTTTATQEFSNNTGADLTVPTSSVICGGAATGPYNFTTTPSGAAVNWTNDHPEIGLPANGNNNIAAFTAINNTATAITATISVTATLNGCPNTKNFTITVNPEPPAPAVISPVNYCHNDPATPLTASVSPGHELQWFTTATGGTANTILPTPNTSTVGTTTYFISQVNTTTGCESDRVAIIVNVSFIPVVTGSTATDPLNCATPTGQINLQGLNASTLYSIRYVKDGGAPTTVSLSSNGAGIIQITGLTAGRYENIVVINNGCESNISGPFILTDPSPPPTPAPGAAVTICEGLELPLTASSTENSISWNWTGPNGFTSTQQNPVINNALPGNSGTYSVTITKNNCTSAPASVSAIVYPRPEAPAVNANTTACLKSDIQLQASTSFAGTVAWSWTGPNGFTSTDQNPLIPDATNAMTGSYQVTATSNLGGCTSPAATTVVSILPIPVIVRSSHINPVGCSSATGSIVLNGLLPSTLYGISFIKDGVAQAPVNLMSAPDGTVIIGGLRAGTYTELAVSFNGCSSDKAGPFNLEDTAPFSVVTSTNGALCEGSTLSLSARVTSPGAATYSWTGPGGFTSALQNPVIPNATTVNAGVYQATVTINGCSGRSSVTAIISSPTIGGSTNADAAVCPGQNDGVISLSGYHGSVLRWEYSINNGQSWDPVANTSPALNYSGITVTTQYRAVVQSGICAAANSDITTISVLPGVNTVTMQPLLIETCNHDTTVTFSAAAFNEGTGPLRYYWYVNGNVEGSSNPFSFNIHVPQNNPAAKEFEVYAVAENNSGCNERSTAGRIVVHALPTPQIHVSPSTVQREPKFTFLFTDISPEGSADLYTWNVGDTSGRTMTSREISYDYKRIGTFRVSLFVEDKNTGCTARDSVDVTIVPVPGSLFIPNAFYPGSNYPELRTFKLKGTGIKKYRLLIFDAWGKVVFETTDLNADGSPKTAWNGNYMNTGRPMPQDAYTWKIVEIEFENGKPWNGMSYNGSPAKYFGNLTLFR